ncbi:murein biosynthesis integral membrane protein MurJ [Lysobacter korlensis]|uniref:Murein biosynthesis integral membrane protein MurJ n=1 Tax=Lysobacter korlensis TaxID=553636 RepID=A0ABV6RUT3_9GAMM
MTESDGPGIGRASALLASGTLVSRVLGFVKVIVLANTIGQVGSASANAFGLANQLPNNIYALIAGGVLGAVLVPSIVRASLGSDGGQAFINKLVTLGIVVFAGLTLVATLAAPLLVRLYAQGSADGDRGFDPATMALATAFAWWCLPQIFFYALYSLLGEVLNARQAFGPFTWAPVLNNLVAIAGLLVLASLFDQDSLRSPMVWTPALVALLAGSATLGVAAQALILTVFWRRTGLGFKPDFAWRGVGLRSTGRAAGWVFGMVLVTQLAGIVQSRVASIASTADTASIATLQNSWLIFMLPHSVIAVSVATAYFTRMAGDASRGNTAALRSDVSAALRGIGLVIVFAAVAVAVVSFPLARVFEQSFDDVGAMASVLIGFLVGLVPFSALFVLQRAFYALDDTRTPFFVQVAQAALFVLGTLLVAGLPVEWIAVGLALVTSIAGTVQAVLLAALLRRRLGGVDGRLLVRRHVQYAVFAVTAGVLGAGAVFALGGFTPGGFAQSGIPQALLTVVVAGTAMGLAYLGLLTASRNPDLVAVIGPVLRRFRRGR